MDRMDTLPAQQNGNSGQIDNLIGSYLPQTANKEVIANVVKVTTSQTLGSRFGNYVKMEEVSKKAILNLNGLKGYLPNKIVSRNALSIDDNLNSKSLDHCYNTTPGLLSDGISSTKTMKQPRSTNEGSKTNDIRFEVISVKYESKEIVLELSNKDQGTTTHCILRGFWSNASIKEGDIVNVLATLGEDEIIIDDKSGLLIVNPDHLVSSTAVVSTLFCPRKTVLGEIFRGWDAGNFSMILGTIVHRLFQTVPWDDSQTEDSIKTILKSVLREQEILQTIYALKKTESQMEDAVLPYIPHILSWIKGHRRPAPNVHVTHIEDIEENIWCPRYGIKGKIDVSLGVEIHRKGDPEKKILPLELKTGEPTFSTSHLGQVILYSMMMESVGSDPGGGLLVYLSGKSQVQFVDASHQLQRGLVQMRNDLASYLVAFERCDGRKFLPDCINNFRTCSKCPYLLPCTILQKNDDPSHNTDHAMTKLAPEATTHLSDAHVQYFLHRFNLLRLELSAQDRGNAFWLESASARESAGTCFSLMVLCNPPVMGIHSFKKQASVEKSLKEVGLLVGDFVVVSSESRPASVAIARGTIIAINENCVDIALDSDDLYRRWREEIFRIDRHDSTGAILTNFQNLLRLMSNEVKAARLRHLIVDKEAPLFAEGLKREVADRGRKLLRPMNETQQRAILKALRAKDYVLFQGMPGTGKTSTIVTLVKLLVSLGHSVLLTSYTHSAVDNILVKLKYRRVPFLRLGPLRRIHPEIRPFALENLSEGISSVSELSTLYKSQSVVATTCLGINHTLFSHTHFDFCIVDEASQVLQTACLGPLFHAGKAILVGDSKQLTPVVKNREARALGLDESLFSRLESSQSKVELNIQYRMNKEIMRLCNELTYGGAMKCGSEHIANATVELRPNIEGIPCGSWQKAILSTRLDKSVIFCNTDGVPAPEGTDGHVRNDTEVLIVASLLGHYLQYDISQDIGVMSPYRSQVQLLRETIHESKVEVNTIDQYQGQDKSIIILSCVRSQVVQGDILQDEKRLNVALTRSKHKLIIIGSQSTLQQYRPFKRLLEVLRADQIVNLPAYACITNKK